jgi:hypothetical protein
LSGATLHFVDGENGIKDIDVYTFFAEDPTLGPFPPHWRLEADFGHSELGRHSADPPRFVGRRVDLIGRSLPVPRDADPMWAVRNYLRTRRTPTASHVAAKAVVGLDPPSLRGAVIWPEAT